MYTLNSRDVKFNENKSLALLRGGIITRRDLANIENNEVIVKDASFAIARRIYSYTDIDVLKENTWNHVNSGDENALIAAFDDIHNPPETFEGDPDSNNYIPNTSSDANNTENNISEDYSKDDFPTPPDSSETVNEEISEDEENITSDEESENTEDTEAEYSEDTEDVDEDYNVNSDNEEFNNDEDASVDSSDTTETRNNYQNNNQRVNFNHKKRRH